MTTPDLCYGPDADQHAKGCSASHPLCRWRRAATRCLCDAYHYPHRKGSGFCGNADRRALEMYGDGTIAQLPIGPAMRENVWWAARAEIADAWAMGGAPIVRPALADRARALLEGRATPAARVPALRGGELRRWFAARRAVCELLLPYLRSADGSVVPPDLDAAMRAILSGAAPVPRRPDARKPRAVRDPLTWKAPAREATEAPF